MEKYNSLKTLSGLIIFIAWLDLIATIILTGYFISEKADISIIILIIIGGLIGFIFTLSYGKLIQLTIDIRENQKTDIALDVPITNTNNNIETVSTNNNIETVPTNNNIEAVPTNENFDKEIINLNEYIKRQKKKFLGPDLKHDILGLLDKMITSKDIAISIINRYNYLTNKDLINDLKGLTSNYSGKKEFLKVFIKFEIVKSEYPHDIIVNK